MKKIIIMFSIILILLLPNLAYADVAHARINEIEYNKYEENKENELNSVNIVFLCSGVAIITSVITSVIIIKFNKKDKI